MDLDAVLELSRPRRNQSLLAPILLAAILLAALVSVPGEGLLVQSLVPLAMAAIILFSLRYASATARRQREEAEQLRVVDEAIRLGNWQQASGILTHILTSASPRPHVRIQALIYLGGLLNRVGRFSDVIRLYDYLTEQAQFPPHIILSLKSMRAYAMLRDERLADAYEAIAELRRENPQNAGIVTVLEMYRLMKTGHHEEVLQMHEKQRKQLAAQLGHRAGDGWAIAAASALALNRQDEAYRNARNAILLQSPENMIQRLPECAPALRLVSSGGAVA